jgi:hypothetical protein
MIIQAMPVWNEGSCRAVMQITLRRFFAQRKPAARVVTMTWFALGGLF